jgi:hypothetical protein
MVIEPATESISLPEADRLEADDAGSDEDWRAKV